MRSSVSAWSETSSTQNGTLRDRDAGRLRRREVDLVHADAVAQEPDAFCSVAITVGAHAGRDARDDDDVGVDDRRVGLGGGRSGRRAPRPRGSRIARSISYDHPGISQRDRVVDDDLRTGGLTGMRLRRLLHDHVPTSRLAG